MKTALKYWWPAALWAVAIYFFSTEVFSGEHTSRFINPILRWLFRRATPVELWHMHLFIRKVAHVFVYFVFSILIFRGVRGANRGWKWKWALAALLIAAAYSATDEYHQLFVPGRGGSPKDVLLDSSGALLGQILAWPFWRRRGSGPQTDS